MSPSTAPGVSSRLGCSSRNGVWRRGTRVSLQKRPGCLSLWGMLWNLWQHALCLTPFGRRDPHRSSEGAQGATASFPRPRGPPSPGRQVQDRCASHTRRWQPGWTAPPPLSCCPVFSRTPIVPLVSHTCWTRLLPLTSSPLCVHSMLSRAAGALPEPPVPLGLFMQLESSLPLHVPAPPGHS